MRKYFLPPAHAGDLSDILPQAPFAPSASPPNVSPWFSTPTVTLETSAHLEIRDDLVVAVSRAP
jgi:hypothetical protein